MKSEKSEMNRNDEQWKDLIEPNIVIRPNEWNENKKLPKWVTVSQTN